MTRKVYYFLGLLKLLALYDQRTKGHLEQIKRTQRNASTKGQRRSVARGRGAKLTFLSNRSQNKIIDIISKAIKEKLCDDIRHCMAWSLIADTTPDVSRKEQLSICVRIVHNNGRCTEHILSCVHALGTKAVNLFQLIKMTLQSCNITYEKLFGQAYDGASNMSGCYNRLQALIKQEVGEKAVFVHCYAHVLNLVLSDCASVALNAANLFSYLESMYPLFTKCAEIEKVFRNAQEDRNLRYISLKRINTVRWNSRELSLDVFLQMYDCTGETLQKAANDTSLERDYRSRASGLLENIVTKQFVATALLFKEIFQFTGPLSRYLQSVDLDFSKAISMVNDITMQLEKLRKRPDDILSIISQSHSYEKLNWKPIIVRFHRRMDGEVAPDEPALTPQGEWTRNTFFVVLDQVISSMRNRFGKNEALLSAYHLFSPQNFKSITDSCNSADEIREELLPFCNRYAIDATRCGMELINFARVYETFLSHVGKEIE